MLKLYIALTHFIAQIISDRTRVVHRFIRLALTGACGVWSVYCLISVCFKMHQHLLILYARRAFNQFAFRFASILFTTLANTYTHQATKYSLNINWLYVRKNTMWECDCVCVRVKAYMVNGFADALMTNGREVVEERCIFVECGADERFFQSKLLCDHILLN